MNKTGQYLPLLLMTLLLTGCSDSDVKEVKQWMEQVRKETKVVVEPVTAPKTFIPFSYEAMEEIDPFDPNKLLAEIARSAKPNPLAPDMTRRKELLENYPLDTMHMVGTMEKNMVIYALLQIDRDVHQIRKGQRLGQNFGLVTDVGEASINIKETVQDAAGEWVERMSTLELQDSNESKETMK